MSTTPSMSLPVVMFCHQTHYFAVEAAQVRRQTSVAPVSQESVIAFADLLHGADHSDVDTRCTQWLELVGTTQHFWLGLHSPADLVELSQGDIYRLPITLQTRRQLPALRALAWYQDQLVSLLDARDLQR